jgi:hypothetical protein
MSSRRRQVSFLLIVSGVAIALAALAPVDGVLGSSARIVYLHGASVWASLASFAAAALAGLAALLLSRNGLHRWSLGLGRAATVLWLLALLLSLVAMQVSWNGLYLAEPRWQVAVRFGVAAVLLQVAVALLHRPWLASLLNVLFFLLLTASLVGIEAVMHPSSPVFTSNSAGIRLFFLALLGCSLAVAAVLARVLRPNA